MKTTRPFTALLLSTLLLSGCEKSSPTPAAEETKAPAASASGAQNEAAPSAAPEAKKGSTGDAKPESVFQLLEEGKGEKRTLRYSFEKGRSRTLTIDQEMLMKMESDGKKMPAAPPILLKLVAKVSTESVEANGDARRTTKFDSVEMVPPKDVPPEALAQVQKQFEPLKSMTIVEELSARGIVQKLDIELDAKLAKGIQQMLDGIQSTMNQVVVPLPNKPVGVGARWQSESKINTFGMELIQISRFTLVGFEGEQVKLEVTVEQKADPKKFAPPGLPPTMKVSLDKLESAGSGELSYDLKALTGGAKMEVSTDLDMTVTAPAPGGPVKAPPPRSTKLSLAMKLDLDIQ